jgi:hypothetical protein
MSFSQITDASPGKFATNAESHSVRFVSRGTANRKCTALADVGVTLKGLRPTGGDGKSKRFSVRISSLECLLVNRGEFTLISPVGLVKPFLMLMRGKVGGLSWRGKVTGA